MAAENAESFGIDYRRCDVQQEKRVVTAAGHYSTGHYQQCCAGVLVSILGSKDRNGMEWQIATQTHRGNVRRINEDALMVEKSLPLMMIADGMGGHEAGDVASRMLVDRLSSLDLPRYLAGSLEVVKTAILSCNSSLIEYAARKLEGRLIGSTVVAMLAEGGEGVCLWAGDSRLYRVRDLQIEQLTGDHSHVADLVRGGLITDEEAVNHPSSNIITRAVGITTDLELDSVSFDVKLNDTFLLCSDGLYNEIVSEELLLSMLAGDIWQSSNQMLNLCLSRKAKDNVTFIIARAVTAADDDDMDATLTFYPQK